MSSGLIHESLKHPALRISEIHPKVRLFIIDSQGVIRPASEGSLIYSSEVIRAQAISSIKDFITAYKVSVKVSNNWVPVMGVSLGDAAYRWRKDRFVVQGSVEDSHFIHSLLGES